MVSSNSTNYFSEKTVLLPMPQPDEIIYLILILFIEPNSVHE